MASELRRFPRVCLQVEFRGRDGTGAGQLVFEGSDLSAGGAFLRSALLLEQGERLALEFQVPGVPTTMKASARVAWVRRFPKDEEPAGMGVEFIAMSEEDRDVLTRYLARPQTAP